MTSDRVIRRAAYCLVGICLAVLGSTFVSARFPAARRWLGLAPTVRAGYEKGTEIDLDSSLYRGQPRTLFVFSRETCGSCVASGPYVRELAQTLTKTGVFRVMFVTQGPITAAAREFAESEGFGPSDLVVVDLKALHVRSIPTMVVVDAQGQILLVREGAPSVFEQPLVTQSIVALDSPR